jgi:hypothetical protein
MILKPPADENGQFPGIEFAMHAIRVPIGQPDSAHSPWQPL